MSKENTNALRRTNRIIREVWRRVDLQRIVYRVRIAHRVEHADLNCERAASGEPVQHELTLSSNCSLCYALFVHIFIADYIMVIIQIVTLKIQQYFAPRVQV